MKKIRILIADDHAIVRTGLSSLLSTQKDFTVVGEAEDGAETVQLALELSPDLIVMDYRMPRLDGAAATAAILAQRPEVRILILTSYSEADGIARALRSGAAGALLKTDGNAALLAAIRNTADGQHVISPEIKQILDEAPPADDLTDRQIQILELITRGLTNRDIAELLDIRVDSVKKHANTIFDKIGATNRAEAVAIALRKQLV